MKMVGGGGGVVGQGNNLTTVSLVLHITIFVVVVLIFKAKYCFVTVIVYN